MRYLFLIAAFAVVAAAQTEQFNHVKWTASVAQPTVSGSVVVKLDAEIDPEWHMYSFSTPPGPIPTTLKALETSVSKVTVYQPKPVRKFDPNFNSDTETFEGHQTFYAKLELAQTAAGPLTVTLEPRYQTCSGTSCIPPRTRQLPISLTVAANAPAQPDIPSDFTTGSVKSDEAWLPFLGLAFGFGLAAVFTPCVFPMIPITMSYFVGQKGGLGQALTFCLGIVVLFTGMGLLATAFLGPAGVNHIGANVWVNAFISIVFFVFGLSLLGAFEITLPSGLLTKLNSASGTGGFLSTMLMGLTFALTSFACVGPFFGTLLAASVTGDKLRPALGMMTFAGGLSSPFFLLALFPGWLKKLPRSGEWMSRVKVVMGFIVMAAMLKYLHNVDDVLHTGFLTRERFLAAWIVLMVMMGAYLLGLLKLPGISSEDELGAGRLLLGIVAIATGLSLVPGMFGARLGDIEAFIPQPVAGSAMALGGGGAATEQLVWMENDLDGAFVKAKAEGKKVLVDFTGDACTNCKWMKANMFTRPEILAVAKNLVLVELYTDRSDPLSQKYQEMEAKEFKTVAIPFYVLYDADRKVLATFPDRTDSSAVFLAFLNAGGTVPATAAGDLEFTPFKTLDGAPLSPASWAGKVVVLNYWATWCVPCRQEIPEFNKMAAELGPKGVEVVGISMDEEGAAPVKEFLKQNPMKYTVGLGTGSPGQLPLTVVLDKAGKTVQRFEGFTKPEAIRAAVQKALGG
ncbi:MAG: Redoxin domain protein [Bryobacterales bacterium]|nr:Redoxin domain protein [Bryobacterales bacterium]